MEFLHHAFDVVDDRTNDDADAGSSHLFLLDFNREHLQFICNEEESRPLPADPMDEPVILSQQLSQLSTGDVDDGKRQHSPTTNPLEPAMKKNRPDPAYLAKFDEPFPTYLQKDHGMLQEILSSSANDPDVSFDDLQALAFFRHQMGIYQQHERLWLKFIRFGTGQLSDEDRLDIEQTPIIQPTTMTRMMYGPFWMATVKRWLLSRPNVQTLIDRGETDEQYLYEFGANERLQQARERLEHYRQEYHEKKARCLLDHANLEAALIQCVEQQGIHLFRLKTDFKSHQLTVEFREHLLQLRFEQEHPTEYQVKLALSFCIHRVKCL